MRKGIILAGGSATRLNPTTKYITKHLLPVYDKPMINYSLSILMLAKIKNILIICNKRDLNSFQDYLGNGRRLGIKISYAIQKKPNGLAESFIIGEKFLKRDPVALILGDNIFFGSGLQKILVSANKSSKGVVFLKRVTDPERFGVAYFDKKNKNLQKIVEKPKKPKSNFAVTGLYFYENDIVKLAKKLKPSARGELEISELNNLYIKKRKLSFVELSRSTIWKDAGTFDSLIDSGNIIKNFQEQNLIQIGFLEEISIRNKWIDKSKILQNIKEKHLRDYLKKI